MKLLLVVALATQTAMQADLEELRRREEAVTPKMRQAIETAEKICTALQKWEDAFTTKKTDVVKVQFSDGNITCNRGTDDVVHKRTTRQVQSGSSTGK